MLQKKLQLNVAKKNLPLNYSVTLTEKSVLFLRNNKKKNSAVWN